MCQVQVRWKWMREGVACVLSVQSLSQWEKTLYNMYKQHLLSLANDLVWHDLWHRQDAVHELCSDCQPLPCHNFGLLYDFMISNHCMILWFWTIIWFHEFKPLWFHDFGPLWFYDFGPLWGFMTLDHYMILWFWTTIWFWMTMISWFWTAVWFHNFIPLYDSMILDRCMISWFWITIWFHDFGTII